MIYAAPGTLHACTITHTNTHTHTHAHTQVSAHKEGLCDGALVRNDLDTDLNDTSGALHDSPSISLSACSLHLPFHVSGSTLW